MSVLIGKTQRPLILASASAARGALLRGAGLSFEIRPAEIDESEAKEALESENATALNAAETLAELKAQHVSTATPDAFVIGADQLLECDGVWFDKARDRDHAREQLRALSGRAHRLATAVCVSQGGARIWSHGESPRLTMRALSDDFLDRYLDAAGEQATGCVGGYRLEELGSQLFDKVEGDYFTILGLPLLPLLAFLRGHGIVPT